MKTPSIAARQLPRLLLLAAALAAAGCSKPEEPVPATPPVQTLTIQAPTSTPFRRFPGEVAAVTSTELSFDVAGRIINRPATQGMVAKQGELLAELDPTNFKARFDAANSRYGNARSERDRQRTLRERGVISEQEFQQFQTTFEVAETEFRTAQRDLDDTKLLAPFDGRVARMIANNQQNVQAKQAVLIYQNIASLEVDIQIPESAMSLSEQGITAANARDRMEARVEFAALPGKQFDLTLKSFSTEATQSARTFRVTFDLEPPSDANILPGMTSTVLVRARQPSEAEVVDDGTFHLPVQAVSTDEGKSWVWRLDPQTMQVTRLPVEMLGITGTTMTVRTSDLKAGDEIVSSGVRFLSNGMTVRRMASTRP